MKRKKLLNKLTKERKNLDKEQKKTSRRGAVLSIVLLSILIALTVLSVQSLSSAVKIVLIVTPILMAICVSQYTVLKNLAKNKKKDKTPKKTTA